MEQSNSSEALKETNFHTHARQQKWQDCVC